MDLSIFDCVSPLDYRYYGDDPKMVELLGPHVTERAYILSELEVEAAAVQVFARRKLCSEAVAEEVAQAIHLVTPEEVHEEDARIHHDTRAMVNCLQRHVSDEAKPFIHLAMTSFDVKDTALALRLKRAAHDAVIPELIKLEKTLIDLARREKDTLQMGRTHGQHAVPITFGFAIVQYVSRLGGRPAACSSMIRLSSSRRSLVSSGSSPRRPRPRLPRPSSPPTTCTRWCRPSAFSRTWQTT